MYKVYIVILNYRRWQDVIECLDSVFRSVYKDFTVIVVDNDSQNNSLEYLKDWANGDTVLDRKIATPIKYKYYHCKEMDASIDFNSSNLFFIQNATNAGFAAGNNLVLQFLLKNDAYIWLLNPDMVVKEDTLYELVEFVNHQPSISITGSVVKSFLHQDEIFLFGGAKINFNSATVSLIKKEHEIPQMDFVYGASLFAHTKHFKEIGLLPEDYFLFWEEADWCYQAKRKGYKLLVCKTAICYDKFSTSIGKGFLADYYYTRNGLLFLAKYKKEKIATAIVFATLRFIQRIITGKWSKARGVFKGIWAFLRRNKYENQ
jgi:GT2 family glycosyltransferase